MISEAVIRRLFKGPFKSAAFIVSSEFAELIMAAPGDERYSKLSYIMRLFYYTRIEAEVSSSAYLPASKASTAIVTLQTRELVDEHLELMQELFRQEDKKTANALREALIWVRLSDTKREARAKARGLDISTSLLEAPVSRLSLEQILELDELLTPN